MSRQDFELDIFRKELAQFFSSHKYFYVELEGSNKGECDHIYLRPPLHTLLVKQDIHFTSNTYTFGAIQRDKEKLRLRFYKRNIDHYKGLKSVFEKYKLKSPYYNSKDSREAYCFDFHFINENKKQLIIADLNVLLEYFRRIIVLAKKSS